MNRREWLSRTALDLKRHTAVAGIRPRPRPGPARRPEAAHDHRREDDPHRPREDPTRRRQGDDQRARPLRPRLRHLHPACPRRRDRRGQVPQALPARQGPAHHRGPLAIELRQFVLAQRPRARQRHQRRGHGPVGHPRQARRRCRSINSSAASAARRSIPTATPSGQTFEDVEKSARALMDAGQRHVRVQIAMPGLATYGAAGKSKGDDNSPARTPGRKSGNRAAMSAPCPSCSSTCARSSATRWNCCTTCTNACRRSWPSRLAKDLEPFKLFFLEDPVQPRGRRLLREAAPADQHADRDGRTVQQPQRVGRPHQQSADRLHPHPHLAGRRPDDGPQGGGAVRVLRRPHRLARPRRRLAGRPRGQRPSRPRGPELRHPGGAASSRRPSRTSSPAARSSRTATTGPTTSRASASTSTRSWRPSSRSPTTRRSITAGATSARRTGRW